MYRLKVGLICLLLLAGCKAKSGAGLPPSEFEGKVPNEVNQRLLELNYVPTKSMRGSTGYYFYDDRRALLTVTHRLRSSSWTWTMNKSDIEPSIRADMCERFSDELALGVGIRNWFVGSGGFVTKTLVAEDCQ
ncbi:hypothetical protein A8L45_01850 [Veronia pacifica]|uniref:Lipoprotein n=2 Tax=Veronia pacifica TaxID=1080227 RepID=A0A1C3ERD4_9GAMM|nr:hypothetical protein A8L45_01850 [Veronia pacifica]